jgi:hypothetical protein
MNARILIGALCVNQLVLYIAARKIQKELERQRQRYMTLHEITTYIIHMCDEQGIDLSDFDLIALGFLKEKHDV